MDVELEWRDRSLRLTNDVPKQQHERQGSWVERQRGQSDRDVAPAPQAPRRQKLEKVVIRFAGDSGDGMQLTGDRFTSEAALFGNDLATQPNYPAEIRAPQGTLPGVSSFQIQIADYDILTAGDRPDVLVAMNPAALKANVADLPRGGLIIANSDEFTKRNLAKVGYEANPLETDELSDYVVQAVAMTTLTLGAVESIGATKKDGQRAKNMFALGLLSWMYGRELEQSEIFIREKFARKPEVAEANVLALKAGWNYGETTEAFATTYEVSPAKLKSGDYRQISGNTALAYGIVAAGQLANTQVVLGTYPITPASDILHELSKHKNFNVLTFQAEDEIAGIGAALGASYGGALGVTSTSGPGISLKSEAIGLGVMTELPLLVVDVQRGGPSTGLPTKTEQADLLQALYGRNGESPVAVLAPRSPSDCFDDRRRGRAHRADLPHAGDHPVRRRDRQRLRAVADPGRHHVCADRPHLRQGRRAVPALRPRPGDAGPPVRGAGHARSGAPHRRPGSRQRFGQHLLRAEEPRPDGAAAPGQDRRHRGARPRGRRPDRRRRTAAHRLGQLVRPHRRGVPARTPQGHQGRPRAPAPPEPVPGEPRRGAAPLPEVVLPEMNLGQLALLLRGKFLVDVQSVTKVEGMAFLADEVEGIIDAALDGTLAKRKATRPSSHGWQRPP